MYPSVLETPVSDFLSIDPVKTIFVSSVRLPLVIRLLPATSVNFVSYLQIPSFDIGVSTFNDQFPVSETKVLYVLPSIITSTSDLASPIPMIFGIVSFISPSVLEMPVSDDLDNPTLVLSISVSTVSVALFSNEFPALSVILAV